MGQAYKDLIQQWRDVLPTQSMCLTVPVVMPDEADDIHAARQSAHAKRMIKTKPTAPSVQEDE